MIVLGIDPGATVGLAILDVPAIGRPKWLWSASIREDRDLIEWATEASAIVPQVIAIEQVDGYAYDHVRSAALIKTARLEGKLVEQARSLGHEPLMVSRAQWRKALCRNGSAGDAIVKRALELQTVGMPKRTNAHCRDAAGVAIVGARMARAQRRTA